MKAQLFANGQLTCQGAADAAIAALRPEPLDTVDPVVKALRGQADWLRGVPVDALIGWLDAVGRSWMDRRHPIQQQLGPMGLNFLLYWLKREHLERTVDLAMRGDRRLLDGFRSSQGRDAVWLKAQPRGLAVHWLAGNVPLLGLLSFVQGLLTKNVNLLKVSAQRSLAIPLALEAMRPVVYEGGAGKLTGEQVLRTVAAIYLSHDERSAAEALSRSADVRVAWGSREAMEAVLALPKPFHAEDVLFGPKYSFIVIGREALAGPVSVDELALRVALDASLFDQHACSSPHTVFVESGATIDAKVFAEKLAKAMEATLARVPRRDVSPAEAMAILGARTEHELSGDVFSPATTDWTVIYAPEPLELAAPCRGRVVFVKPVDDVMRCAQLAGPLTQTVGTALSPERALAFADAATARGVDRCVPVGRMSLYDLPWDGMFVMDRFVRWTTAGANTEGVG